MQTRVISALCVPAVAGAITLALGLPATSVQAQGRDGRGAAGVTQGRGAAAAAGLRTDVDLLHVMRGILFPASNVVLRRRRTSMRGSRQRTHRPHRTRSPARMAAGRRSRTPALRSWNRQTCC